MDATEVGGGGGDDSSAMELDATAMMELDGADATTMMEATVTMSPTMEAEVTVTHHRYPRRCYDFCLFLLILVDGGGGRWWSTEVGDRLPTVVVGGVDGCGGRWCRRRWWSVVSKKKRGMEGMV